MNIVYTRAWRGSALMHHRVEYSSEKVSNSFLLLLVQLYEIFSNLDVNRTDGHGFDDVDVQNYEFFIIANR